MQDAADDVIDVALVSLLHGGGEVALAFGLCAVFADYRSAENFDFGDVVVRLRCVVEHRVHQVILVAVSGLVPFVVGAAELVWGERLLCFDVSCEVDVMLVLN